MDTREILLEIRAMVENWKAKAEFLEKQLNVIGGTGECAYWRERAEHAERERDVLKNKLAMLAFNSGCPGGGSQ